VEGLHVYVYKSGAVRFKSTHVRDALPTRHPKYGSYPAPTTLGPHGMDPNPEPRALDVQLLAMRTVKPFDRSHPNVARDSPRRSKLYQYCAFPGVKIFMAK
jgi:hypothetical protein